MFLTGLGLPYFIVDWTWSPTIPLQTIYRPTPLGAYRARSCLADMFCLINVKGVPATLSFGSNSEIGISDILGRKQ